jgi:hypothetical protein
MFSWINKLDALVNEVQVDVHFQGVSRKEAVLVCVKNIWNEEFNRNDSINFNLLGFMIDTNGNENQEPPHVLMKEMGGEDIVLRKEALINFKGLLS